MKQFSHLVTTFQQNGTVAARIALNLVMYDTHYLDRWPTTAQHRRMKDFTENILELIEEMKEKGVGVALQP